MSKVNGLNRATWIGQANCKSVDINLFFPEDGNNFDKKVVELCARCPVIEPCQEWAIYHEKHGYQGGLTPRQRYKIRLRLGVTIQEPQNKPNVRARPS